MAKKELRHYKALYFDLHLKDLQKYYAASNPTGAYRRIQRFLENHNFTHEQYSGYHSGYQTTDLEIFDLIGEMNDAFPWLKHCINNFEVTNVGVNHDLLMLFEEEVEDPLKI